MDRAPENQDAVTHPNTPDQRDQEPIGRILLRLGMIDDAELSRALAVQRQNGDLLGTILRNLGMLSDEDWARALSAQTGIPLVLAADFPETPVIELQISHKFLKERHLLPLARSPDRLELAMADPLDAYAVEAMELAAELPIERRIATPRDIATALDQLYDAEPETIADLLDKGEQGTSRAGDADIERLKDLASEAPIVRLVDHLLSAAIEARASDIHLEPFEHSLRVRFRIDGILRESEAPPEHMAPALLSRIKILAKLNIAERRLAQDGRIRIRLQGRKVDLRVSTLPSLYGESVVIRILEQKSGAPDFLSLGLSSHRQERLLTTLEQHNGIVLATGPTGSGKTTSLYALMNHLNDIERKIITVEDPVEYEIPGLTQIHVNADIGLTFANLLRSIVRHDPDVIMIGEMRDFETAEIAVQSALTGHMVLSTLHTNDAPGAITRMLDMGVEDYLLVSTLRAVIAQRLVRRLCPECRAPYRPVDALIRRLGLEQLAEITGQDKVVLYRATGCKHCSEIGYVGRIGIYELMIPDEKIRGLVLARADVMSLKRAALESGMTTMFRDGLMKALDGTTTLEEVGRVAQAP